LRFPFLARRASESSDLTQLAEQRCLPFLVADVLAHHDHAIRSLAGHRPKRKLGHFFAPQAAPAMIAEKNAAAGEVEVKGKIAQKYDDSVEWWVKKQRPPEGAPNVIVFLLDDTGFAQLG